jgi:methylase of polypeptide subunit release factors
MINKNFYPTPKSLFNKMWGKVDGTITTILEPSAGKGDIVDFIKGLNRYDNYDISCIENDTDLQATLRGKQYKVIDSDFLEYSGLDKFDLIIANPPFDAGDVHLLKAINIMYSGQIVFLLNAETIKNPYTNTRKLLVQKLTELNAEIEYIQNAFLDAERKTGVEVALVYINIEKNIEDDLFVDCGDQAADVTIDAKESMDLAPTNTIEFMVQEFNATVKNCLEMVEHFYKNYRRIGGFISIAIDNEKYISSQIREQINEKINLLLQNIRKSYWKDVLELKEVKNRMTKKVRDEFHQQIQQQSHADFTESNIRAFIINLIGNYENILNQAVEEIFQKMTEKHHWCDESSKNIHYFTGWKTNKAYYVNKKVILPMFGYCGGAFYEWGRWKLSYNVKSQLHDIDVVMNYFKGAGSICSIAEAIENAFTQEETRNIESTFFIISVYKKGTIHLTFRDENIRWRFNVCACKNRNWLWKDYGIRGYGELTHEEREIVESFEGKESYIRSLGMIGYTKQNNCLTFL